MSDLLRTFSVNVEWQLFAGSFALAAVLSASLGLATGWLLRRRAAPIRYGLMLAGLSMAVVAPLLPAPAQHAKLSYVQVDARDTIAPQVESIAMTTAAETATAAGDRSTDRSKTPPPPIYLHLKAIETPEQPSWPLAGAVLCLIWVGGAGIGLARIAWSVVCLRRFMRTLHRCENAAAQASLGEAAEMLGLNRRPDLLESRVAPVPMAVGLFRPVIVLPADLPQSLDAIQLQAIFLHEAAHIAHRDLWIGLFQRLAGALFWWCPLVHALNRRIADLREDICDNYVLQVQGDGLRLAEVLVDMAQRACGVRFALVAGAMGAIDERPGLAGRIQRLLHERRNTMTRMNRLAVLGTLSFSLVIGGTILATTLRAADQKAADAAKKDLLSAEDFWESTGKQSSHQFDDAALSEIKRAAADQTATAARRLRASKLQCDLAGKTRLRDDLGAEPSNAAIAVAMKYLEGNLGDGTVQKFSPEKGFTHITVSKMSDDAAGIWVLIESVDDARRGGLNIRVDPATKQVTRVNAWGKPQAAADKNAAWSAKLSLAVADGNNKLAIQKELTGVSGKPVHIDGGDAFGVDLEIQPLKEPASLLYVATMKVTKAGTVLSMPKLTVFADQEAVITIDGGNGKSVSATLKISEKAAPATRPL